MRFLCAIFALCFALTAHAALPAWAFFTGTLKGKSQLGGFPELDWTLVSAAAVDGKKSTALILAGDGLALRIDLSIDTRAGTIAWRLADSRVPVGPWFEALAPRLAPDVAGLFVSGDLLLSGSGFLTDDQPTGRLALSISDAILRNAEGGWTLTGVDCHVPLLLGPNFSLGSESPARFAIKTVATSRFGARNVSITGTLLNSRELRVSAATIEIAGGHVEATEPFIVPLSPLAIDARVRIRSVGLQDFVALIPSGLSSARGKLNGDLRVTWSEAKGIEIGVGELALDETEPTVIRLARSPGFLTGSMPARIEPFPGLLGRLFGIPNPGLKDLRDIELGESELEVSSLRLQLTPEGDARGRTAHVEIDARPLQKRGAVKRVTFDINVDGPFSSLLRLGLNQPFTVEMR